MTVNAALEKQFDRVHMVWSETFSNAFHHIHLPLSILLFFGRAGASLFETVRAHARAKKKPLNFFHADI
jgi:hypothetical protein